MQQHASVHFSQTCPGDSRLAVRATPAYLESFSVSPRLRLLQRFEMMSLPSDTFARRQLTVTPVMRFKFRYKSPKVLCIHSFVVFIRVVTVNNSRRINHIETNFNEYRDNLSYQYVTANHFPVVSHEIPEVSHEIWRH